MAAVDVVTSSYCKFIRIDAAVCFGQVIAYIPNESDSSLLQRFDGAFNTHYATDLGDELVPATAQNDRRPQPSASALPEKGYFLTRTQGNLCACPTYMNLELANGKRIECLRSFLNVGALAIVFASQVRVRIGIVSARQRSRQCRCRCGLPCDC